METSLLTAGRYLKSRYVLLILGAWLVFLMEFLSRTSPRSALEWTYHNIPAFLLNTLIMTGLLLLVTSMTGRTRWSYWIVFVLAFVLSLISGVKMKVLGVPLLPWDFVLTSETEDMTQFLKNIMSLKTIVGLVIYIGATAGLLYKLPDMVRKIRWKERTAFAASAVLLAGAFYMQTPTFLKNAFGIEEKTWNQTDNVLSNGLLLTTFLNLDYMNVNKMKGYDEDSVAAILRNSPEAEMAGASGAKPNIIVILSESFWDPTVIPGITFSKDPLPGFHKLATAYPSGWLLSPQFGGGTANVEFEVLTGNSMRFLPQGSVAYNQFINREVDSLASIAARQGYTSTAISPFHNWFFNSRKIYEYMGFSKYISIEFFNQVFEGPYIADDEVANNIIHETQKSAGPDLVFANTMENHFHYWPGKFKENTIHLEGVDGQAKGFLETYAQGTMSADKMLQKLVEYYSQNKEPTIIAFFGDHLPSLGDDYQAYKDSKYISGPDDPEFLTKMYRTPFLVWDNYLPSHKEDLYMSPSFLGPYILNEAKVQGSYYTNFLSKLYQKIPVIPPKDHYAKMNISENDLKEYETLQYDILFGKQHGYEEFKDRIMDKNYVLGLGPMKLTQADAGLAAGKGAEIEISLQGEDFPETSVVTLNGKVLKTRYLSMTKLAATVPGDLNKPGAWELGVQVSDSKETVIAQTNKLSVQPGNN